MTTSSVAINAAYICSAKPFSDSHSKCLQFSVTLNQRKKRLDLPAVCVKLHNLVRRHIKAVGD